MIAAVRKVYEIVQVIRLYSALGKSSMKVHNLRKAGDGRYLVRVSSKGANGIQKPNASPFSGGLINRMSGKQERIANESRFADYFAEAMAGSVNDEAVDEMNAIEQYEIAPYEEFGLDRKIATRKAADWGLRAMLRNFGCDIEDAEMVMDGGYDSQWIAVAFNAA